MSVFGLLQRGVARAIGQAVGDAPLEIATLSEPVARALELAGHRAVRARLDEGRVALGDGAVDALCAIGREDEAVALLSEAARVVRPGGRVILASGLPFGRGDAAARIAARFLHAGLRDLEQRRLPVALLTSGRV